MIKGLFIIGLFQLLFEAIQHLADMPLPDFIIGRILLFLAILWLSTLFIAWLTGGNIETLLSVAPKSVTKPIAMTVSECMGGLASITAGTVISVFVVIVTAPLLRLLQIDNQAVLGFTLRLSAQ